LAPDERVHYVVGIAGGVPMAQWVREQPTAPTDYEQVAPEIYESVGYKGIMPVAGSRGACYVYNEHDACRFQLHPAEAVHPLLPCSTRPRRFSSPSAYTSIGRPGPISSAGRPLPRSIDSSR
jgi:hypothetical protein